MGRPRAPGSAQVLADAELRAEFVRDHGVPSTRKARRVVHVVLPAISPEALTAASIQIRSMRIHRHNTLSLNDLGPG